MRSVANRSNQTTMNGATWLASFGIATLLGLGVAYQLWASRRGSSSPPEFWNRQVIEPQLIPWLVWATFAPPLMLVFERTDKRAEQPWSRLMLYALLALGVILLHATVSGFALGFWWSFPNPVPRDPAWHIRYQLRTQTVVSLLVLGLIAAIAHLRARTTAGNQRVSAVSGVPEPTPSPTADTAPAPAAERVPYSPLALKTADRVVFVDPRQIDWIEADGDYVMVHVRGAHHRVRSTIAAMESRVPRHLLIRVSRSAIVNVSAITEMQSWFRGNFVIILRDGTRVPTGKRYRDRITRLL